MSYELITVHAGHNVIVPGASGCGYKEHEMAREFAALLIEAFKQVTERTSGANFH
ncbi:hypothetical protein ABNE29_17720 [Paenibacillus larvae]